MIRKTTFGTPLDTQAVTISVEEDVLRHFSVEEKGDKLVFCCPLEQDAVIYGLGETTGPMNKRGRRYISFNTDTADHSESNPSLYGSHNWLLVVGKTSFGVFFDTPARCVFELDWKHSGQIRVICESRDVAVYCVEGETAYGISREFLRAIGPCYLPPLWAFGYGQSRFGYKCEADFEEVVTQYEKAGVPLDYLCMDIDYMDGYADFTVDKTRFPDLKAFSEKLRKKNIRLVPIVDAGVKIQPGEPVYESGIAGGHFCRNREGNFFRVAVWPGMTHLPDFLNADARKWFGEQYRFYTEQGIEGFWNDMNEPAIFYSEYSRCPQRFGMVRNILLSWFLKEKKARELLRDYHSFFHNADGKQYCHYDVHNLYGSQMTRSTNEGLTKLLPGRFLLFSRSSYIGAGRYGGIWTGDNTSCWEHLRLNLRQLPGLNMCGFLFSGADTGGFMGNCTRELLLRWLAVSAFTPLMRNHSSKGTQHQECYRFGDTADFASIVSFRYRILPYLYSEYMKAALSADLFIKPLSFLFPEDDRVRDLEDQLMVGDSVMMTPLIREGETERTVYLPENMTMVRYDGQDFFCKAAAKGEMTIHAELNEVVFFVRGGRLMPVGKAVSNTAQLDFNDLRLLGDGETYALYCDDGTTRNCTLDNVKILTKQKV